MPHPPDAETILWVTRPHRPRTHPGGLVPSQSEPSESARTDDRSVATAAPPAPRSAPAPQRPGARRRLATALSLGATAICFLAALVATASVHFLFVQDLLDGFTFVLLVALALCFGLLGWQVLSILRATLRRVLGILPVLVPLAMQLVPGASAARPQPWLGNLEVVLPGLAEVELDSGGGVTTLGGDGVQLLATDARSEPETYLRHVAVEMPGHEFVLLRWHARQMPLRIYLTEPPAGLFGDPAAVHDAVRNGIFEWVGVAGDALPRFELVDRIGDADIPVVWAREPDGNWYVAHTAIDIRPAARSFGVSRILITGRWSDRAATAGEIYRVLLHEMGHALGLNGHSANPDDIMFESISGGAQGLSDRDRATLKALYARPNGSRVTGARGGTRVDY